MPRGDSGPGLRGVYHRAGPPGPAFGRPDGKLQPDPVAPSGLLGCYRFASLPTAITGPVGTPVGMSHSSKERGSLVSSAAGTITRVLPVAVTEATKFGWPALPLSVAISGVRAPGTRPM